MDLTEEQRRRVIETVTTRIAERIAQERSANSKPSRFDGVAPCAIPPPGSPRYEATLREADRKAEQREQRPRVTPPVIDLATYFDHTLLRPEATAAQIEQLCREAREYRFRTVCVNSSFVSLCKRLIGSGGPGICAVIGFPLGAPSSAAKAAEARQAVADGADELDMVINIGRLKDRDYAYVRDEIAGIVAEARGRIVKVILETGLLTDEEKIAVCALAREAGASFVKTSTGFGPSGATERDVALMCAAAGGLEVKASGGIKDRATALRMIEAGATRLGTSASVGIVTESKGR